MKLQTIFVPEIIHQDALNYLDANTTLVVGFGENKVSLEDGYKRADGVVLRARIPFGKYELDTYPNIKVVARHGVGYENIDTAYAREKGVAVLNTPNANANSVAEHALGLMLSISRNHVKNDYMVRSGNFNRRDELKGSELNGKTLGIIGFGRIGRILAKKCIHGFEMSVAAFSPSVDEDVFEREGVKRFETLQSLLSQSDYIVVLVPLRENTRNLISTSAFEVMKSNAYIIHISRGGVVDEKALYNALEKGRIRGAAVDVFVNEPPETDHPLFSLNNIIFTPHLGAHTDEALRNMALHAAMGAVEVLSGNKPTKAQRVL